MPPRTGSPNKNKAFLNKRLEDMFGEDYHPIVNMTKNAVEYQKAINALDADTRLPLLCEANKLWEGVAQYVEPKLKAVEISGEIDGEFTVTWVK